MYGICTYNYFYHNMAMITILKVILLKATVVCANSTAIPKLPVDRSVYSRRTTQDIETTVVGVFGHTLNAISIDSKLCYCRFEAYMTQGG